MIDYASFLKRWQEFIQKTAVAYGIDVTFFCFLIAVSIKFVYQIESVMDIGLYDETFYLHSGMALIKNGLPSAQYAPLYAVWYYLLSLFEEDSISLYYRNYQLLICLTTLALYVYLRKIRVNSFVAVMTSFLYLVSSIPCLWPHCVFFALFVLLLFLIGATFVKSDEASLFLCAVGILLMSFVRPEYFVSFMLLCTVLVLRMLTKLKSSLKSFRKNLLLILIVGGIATVLLCIFGRPLGGDRSWVAFGQHFAIRYVASHKISINPWTNWESVVHAVFGNTATIGGAVLNNGNAFLQHLLSNAAGYIRLLAVMPLTAAYPLPAMLGSIIKKSEFLLIITMIIYMIRRRHDLSRNLSHRTIAYLSVLTIVISVPVMLSALILFPRQHYVIVQVVLLMIFFSYLISNLIGANIKTKPMMFPVSFVLGLLIFFLTPNRASGWSLGMIGVQPVSETVTLQNLNTIRFLRTLNTNEDMNMLEAEGGFCSYLKNRCDRIDEKSKSGTFNQFLLKHKINVIIQSETLKNDTRFVWDNEFKLFLQQPERMGFVGVKIPGTHRYLFAKKSLLESE